jgi:hypothetical protein
MHNLRSKYQNQVLIISTFEHPTHASMFSIKQARGRYRAGAGEQSVLFLQKEKHPLVYGGK